MPERVATLGHLGRAIAYIAHTGAARTDFALLNLASQCELAILSLWEGILYSIRHS